MKKIDLKHNDIHQVLKEHWGFDSFRPLQKEIAQSILGGRDTLALLPTGGGKSICFQVPAMAANGICIVISPLISLISDQVSNLKQRGIKAVALTSKLKKKEVDVLLDNCVYGDVKFLYLAPERLKSDIVIARLKRMNVSFIAVDESHCISQWGYDFRPAYLNLVSIRELLPDVPVMALTATATPEVVLDIQDKLAFKKGQVFKTSFRRLNLSYNLNRTENKMEKILDIFNKIPGSGIVYVRNRKKTKDISRMLEQNGISSDYYHGGLDPERREKVQHYWMNNLTRVVVATNAFGMGIDKPDVRLVLHVDLPDTLEGYFQEVGRGGRDGEPAYGVAIVEENDITKLTDDFKVSYPTIADIKHIYAKLGNHFQIGYGSGFETVHPFNPFAFVDKYDLSHAKLNHTLKILEKERFLLATDPVFTPSKAKIRTRSGRVSSHKLQHVFEVLLRSYPSISDHHVVISEYTIANRAEMDQAETTKYLLKLHELQFIDYQPKNRNGKIIYLENRLTDKQLHISAKSHAHRKDALLKNIKMMTAFAKNESKCREAFILSYFGENAAMHECGKCDVCRKNKTKKLTEPSEVQAAVLKSIPKPGIKLHEIELRASQAKIRDAVHWLIDDGQITMDPDTLLLKKI